MRYIIHDTRFIINTFYIVFFGVLFSFFFSVKQDQIIGGVSPWFLVESNVLFFLLMTYYIFDWLTTNELHRLQGDATAVLLLIGLFITFFLGLVIIYSIGEGLFKFFLLGIYAVLAPFWDISVYRETIKPRVSTAKAVEYLIFFVGLRFGVALYLMMLIVLHKFFNNPTFYHQTVVLIICYVSIKIIRYFCLVRIL